MIRKVLLAVSLLCNAVIWAQSPVLGIFEDTNFPTDVLGERDGKHRLEIIDNELYAATEKGIFKYSESTNSWSIWALENVNVMDFKVNGDEVVAIIAPQDQKGFRAVQLARLIRFNRNQSEWEDIMDADMGYYYHDQLLTYVMRLAQHPSKPQTLMVAAHPGIWISEDFGSTWDLKFDWLYGYNENQFLGWHPVSSDVLFYTSESPLFAAQILRSGNGGQDWDIINPDASGDNSCHCLAFDPKNTNHILYSGEGCIFESDDCGVTWHCVYRQDEYNQETAIGYTYNIMYDNTNDNVLYAVGCDTRVLCIYVFKSSDNGKTWERIAKSDSFADNWYKYWISESVFLNGKIYAFTNSGVLAFTPNTYSGITQVNNDDSKNISDIYDLFGRKVSVLQPGRIYIQSGKKILIK